MWLNILMCLMLPPAVFLTLFFLIAPHPLEIIIEIANGQANQDPHSQR